MLMKHKTIIALFLAALLFFSGCTQENQKIEVIGALSFEKNNACGKNSVLTAAQEKYFTDLNASIVKGLENGDEVKVSGTLKQEQNCKKIIAENFQVIKRLNTVEKGAIVSIDYIESVKDENVFGTSLREVAEREKLPLKDKYDPLEFRAGSGTYTKAEGKILEAVAKAVIGMRKGEEKNLEIPPEKGFGAYDPSKIIKVNRLDWPLPPNVDPDIGTEVPGVFGTYAVVKDFDKNFIYFDLNPKYAGKTLLFWLKIIDFNNESAKQLQTIVEEGDTIKVDYVGQFLDGNVFDSSENKEPLSFVAGKGQMIKGFDDGVLGMSLGEEKTITIPPEYAYGERNENLVIQLDKNSEDYKTKFSIEEPEVGIELPIKYVVGGVEKDGTAIVTEIGENSITLDLNHKLAGKTLKFWVKVVEIKKAN